MLLERILSSQFRKVDEHIDADSHYFRHYLRVMSASEEGAKNPFMQYLTENGYELGESRCYSLCDLYFGGQGGATKGILRLIDTPFGVLVTSSFPESVLRSVELPSVVSGSPSLAVAVTRMQTYCRREKANFDEHAGKITGRCATGPDGGAIVFASMHALYEESTGTIRRFKE